MRHTRLADHLGRALILAGALTLVWYGWLCLKPLWFQRTARRRLERLSGVAYRREDGLARPRPGDVIGRLEIPRLHLSVIVLEGSDPGNLRVAAGHIQRTAFPGTCGNVGIAAHRDTFFRPLRDILSDDTVLLTTPRGTYRYRVTGAEVVSPRHIQELYPTRDAELTLVTCYPFHYVGTAPQRFIVHACRRS